MAEKKQSKGAPKWMTTFADMSTLLLTFFVIMISMANIDIEKFKEMLGSVRDAFGVQFQQRGNYQAVIEEHSQSTSAPEEKSSTPSQYDAEVIQQAIARAEALEQAKQRQAVSQIEQAIRQSDMGEMAEIQSGSKGIRVRVKGALLFSPGMADLKAQAAPFLGDVVQVLNRFDYYLLVEGHTDSVPITTERFPSNWELSGSRASAVLRHLIAANVAPGRLTSVGLADNYPLASNNTAEGRAKNRRVEFVMTKEAFRPEIY